jgi:hypothetical protein
MRDSSKLREILTRYRKLGKTFKNRQVVSLTKKEFVNVLDYC